MRILLAGTPYFAKVVFEDLLKDTQHTILGLLTQPDKPFGRKQELKLPETKSFLLSKIPNLPILQPERISAQTLDSVRGLHPEIIVVVAYGQILSKEFLDIAPCVNLHASILPHLRGASPLQEMIMANPRFFGVSLMQMKESLDSGAILGISFVKNINQNIEELANILAIKGAQILQQFLQDFEREKQILPLPQCNADSSYCKKIKKSDGEICFDNAEAIYRKYLAFKGWPSIFAKNGLKILEIISFDTQGHFTPAQILRILPKSVIVGCECGSLEISKVQAPSKNPMDITTYFLGVRLKVGDKLVDS